MSIEVGLMKRKKKILLHSFLGLLAVATIHCRERAIEQSFGTLFAGDMALPSSIQNEHDSLLTRLRGITLFEDTAGMLATKLLELMEHHFSEEENMVFPQLALLPSLADGEVPENAKEIIELSEKFKSQLAHMSVEHQMIILQMEALANVVSTEDLPEFLAFRRAVEKHAVAEEEIYFPAAILVGEYLKMKAD